MKRSAPLVVRINSQAKNTVPPTVAAHDTQFSQGRGAAPTDVVIGLDFGTSCTKVVLQIPYLRGGRSFAVPFPGCAPGKSPYLLPSRLWRAPDGVFSLAQGDKAEPFADLKLRLIDRLQDSSGTGRIPSAEEATVAFLALVMQAARQWFLSTKRETVGSAELVWSVNLGLPSANYADKQLYDQFTRVGRAAWLLSTRAGKITATAARKALEDLSELNWDESEEGCELGVHPEVAAEVVGYARSPMRRSGLHLLVDVGAGTIDLCGFVLHDTSIGDRYSLLVADVQRLGAHALHRKRLESLHNTVGKRGRELVDEQNPLAEVPEEVSRYTAEIGAAMAEGLRGSDKHFREELRRSIRGCVVALKKRRDVHSDRWASALPVFLSGGASNVCIYQDELHALKGWLRDFAGCGLEMLALPIPPTLEAAVDGNGFKRLAVAWGLSHPKLDIGEIRTPDQIEDIPQSIRGDAPYIGKEHV